MNSCPVLRGFTEPYEFTYPQVILQVVSLVGLVVGGVGALALAASLRGGEVLLTFGPFTFVGLVVAFVAPLVAALIVNTSGVAGDLYLLYTVFCVPRGSLFYDLSVDEMLVYEPTL